MFDSRSLRRKLGNLIPNDARKQIQNVLTVEWDTHKTVLVEVPGAPPVERDTEMEMEGMGLNRKDGDREHGYGRLDDDWDDHEELMNPNMPIEPPRRQASGSGSGCGLGSSNQYFDRPVPRPPSRTSSDKRLPPVPQSSKDQDPFAHDDDFASSGSFLQPKREPSSGRVRTMEEGWNTFQNRDSGDGNGRRDAGKDVWKGRTIEGSVNSPTSSRGTRDSAQTSSEENPFR